MFNNILPGSGSTDFIPLVNLGGRFQFFSNGTLWIESALPYDEGHYMCKAENGVGTPLSNSIFVAVHGNEPVLFIINDNPFFISCLFLSVSYLQYSVRRIII